MANNQPSRIDIRLAHRLGSLLQARGQTVLSVESCTGGMVAAYLTSLPGSSKWFEGAFVTYCLRAKTRMVGVPEALLQRYGAVSEPAARAMAEGALRASQADLSVAVTGVAGPGGGDVVTPVGTVWFAWAVRRPSRPEPIGPEPIECAQTAVHNFTGDREAVRSQAVNIAVQGLLDLLQ